MMDVVHEPCRADGDGTWPHCRCHCPDNVVFPSTAVTCARCRKPFSTDPDDEGWRKWPIHEPIGNKPVLICTDCQYAVNNWWAGRTPWWGGPSGR